MITKRLEAGFDECWREAARLAKLIDEPVTIESPRHIITVWPPDARLNTLVRNDPE